MPEIRAVITDIDETLLHEDNASHHVTVSQRVLTALGVLDEKGIIVAPATGRNFFRRPWITRLLGFNTYGVFQGGASIVDLSKEELVWERRFPPNIARSLVAQILTDTNPQRLNFGKGHRQPYEVDLREIDDDCFGVWAEIPMQYLPEFQEIMASAPGAQYHDNGGSFGEGIAALHITHAEADKGVATLQLLDLLGVSPEETAVVGDSGNDEPMFNIKGLHSRIAIQNENTPESLLRLADHVVGGVHQDGFAEAVHTHIIRVTT